MKTRGKPGTIPIRFSPRTLIMSRDRLNSLKIVVFWGLLGHLLDRRQFSPVLSYTEWNKHFSKRQARYVFKYAHRIICLNKNMAGRILSRYLILVSIIALLGIGVILSIFYGQYRWITSGMVSSSVEQHSLALAGSFERRARGQLYRVATSISESNNVNAEAASNILNRAISDNETLTGLRYTHANGSSILIGQVDEEPPDGNLLWRTERLYMKFPVVRDGNSIGSLSGSFDLATLSQDAEAFEEDLVMLGTQSRQTSFIWISAATLVTIALCGFVIWLIAKLQAERIRALKVQAEKLSDSDYGEPLKVTGGDLRLGRHRHGGRSHAESHPVGPDPSTQWFERDSGGSHSGPPRDCVCVRS